MRRKKHMDEFRVNGVADRLAPYDAGTVDMPPEDVEADPELVERAATLLAVMPRNQLRDTFEHLLAPYDREKGRRAVDSLIEAAFAIEDETGHIRRVV